MFNLFCGSNKNKKKKKAIKTVVSFIRTSSWNFRIKVPEIKEQIDCTAPRKNIVNANLLANEPKAISQPEKTTEFIIQRKI